MATLNFDRQRLYEATQRGMRTGLQKSGEMLAKRLRGSLGQLGRHTSSAPGSPPNRQRNRMHNSIKTWGYSSSGPLHSIYVGSDMGNSYPAWLEGPNPIVIRPKSVKAIPVPIGFEGRRFRERNPVTLRGTGLIPIKRKGKPMLLALKQGKSIKPLFVLKDRVVIQPRPWLRPGWNAGKGPFWTMYREDVNKSVMQAFPKS